MSLGTQIFISVLSSSGIISLIIWLAKKRISTEIENSVKSRYDSKLEKLKAQITNSQSILTTSFAAQVEGIKATHEKRLEAIDKYWEYILEVEEVTSWSGAIDSILTTEEVEKIIKFNSPHPAKFQQTLAYTFSQMDIQKLHDITDKQKRSIEKARPYVGEKLWLLRYLFIQLIGRVMYKYKEAYDNNENLTHWTKDEFLINSLNQGLTKDEQNFIYTSNMASFEKALNVFKQKMLTEISKITSGMLVGESSLKNAKILSELMERK